MMTDCISVRGKNQNKMTEKVRECRRILTDAVVIDSWTDAVNHLSSAVLERIVIFGTNRIPNTYSLVKIERIEYRIIIRLQETIGVVFEYLKLFE